MNMMKNKPATLCSVALFTLLGYGCGAPSAPTANDSNSTRRTFDEGSALAAANVSSPHQGSLNFTFTVPKDVTSALKMKCYICHGGAETKGGFDLKQMIYQPEPDAEWLPMDLAGVTKIKLAILPIDGEPARMPKRAGSILNPLTQEEANMIAKWTDFPYER